VNLREGDEVVDMAILDPMATLLTVCENGYGKRTNFEEYRVQSRGGVGIINIKTTERNGKVVAMKPMRDADELMLITKDGMIVRTGMDQLRTIGRATQGVRVIALKEGDKLVSTARVVAEDNNQAQLPLGAPLGEPLGEPRPEGSGSGEQGKLPFKIVEPEAKSEGRGAKGAHTGLEDLKERNDQEDDSFSRDPKGSASDDSDAPDDGKDDDATAL
jgi:hypothetical protein